MLAECETNRRMKQAFACGRRVSPCAFASAGSPVKAEKRAIESSKRIKQAPKQLPERAALHI